MRFHAPLCLTLIMTTSYLNDAIAQPDDRVMILTVMEEAFAAVHSNNPDDWRAIQLVEGTSLSLRPRAGGAPEELEMQMWSNEEFLANLKPDGHDYMER